MEQTKVFERIAAGRQAALNRRIPSVRERRKMLKRMLTLLISHREALYSVLADDLGRSRQAAIVSEVLPLIKVIKYLIRKLPALTSPRSFPISWINWPGCGYFVPEPYGQVLVAGSWNYPLLLSLEPVAAAYAAGNQVVLKLPLRAHKTSLFIRWLIEETFVGDEVITVEKEANLPDLLEYQFDYVFYAGTPEGGRDVLRRNAENIVPAVLDLGGKSPAIVDEGSSLAVAARRIANGKFFNAGQSRIAPDYVLVRQELMTPFKQEIASAVHQLYGVDALDNPEYGKIIDADAYERLSRMASRGRLVCGGEKDPERLKLAPTVIDMLPEDDALLQEEILGPVLPLIPFSSERDLIERLQRQSAPPVIYYFGSDSNTIDRLIRETFSGALVVNDTMMQFFNFSMPQSGIAPGGMGVWRGKYSFDTFVHYKPVMKRLVYPDWGWRYLPLKGIWDLILEYRVRWSI